MLRFAGGHPLIPDHRTAFQIIQQPLQPTWYQVAQTGPMAVEVRFVSKRKLSTDDLRIVTEKLPGIWRQATPVISFKQLDAIPTRPGQKHIVFVNEWEAGITPRLQA